MPLAIELAAAQVTHLAPARIAERLNDRFRLLTGGRRRVQRQQTLGAALDWSHDLLSDDERQLLRRLSVFPGTFNIEAAEAVGGSDLAVPVIGTLRSLVNKSLVDARDEDGDVRYRMLETVRLYAEEKLLVAEESEHVRRCHAEHYAGQVNFNWLAEVLQYGKAALVLREAHNIRAAIDWFHGADEPERFAKVVLAAVPLWAASFEEGARWIDAALASRDRLNHDLLGSLMAARCWVAGHRQEWPKAIRIAQAIVEHARDATEPTSWLAFAQATLALTWAFRTITGEEGAREEADRHASTLEAMIDQLDPAMGAYSAFMIGNSKSLIDETEDAARFLELALELYPRDEPLDPNRTATYAFYSQVLHVLGRYEESLEQAEQAAAERNAWRHFSGSTDRGWDIHGGTTKILALAFVDRYTEAKEFATALLSGVENTAVVGAVPALLGNLAAISLRRGDAKRAAKLLGAAGRLGPLYTASAMYRRYEERCRAALGDVEMDGQLNEGGTMSQPEAIAYGVEGIDPA
jgi:tetratricopeptide (TPR) repeat protein